MITIGHLRATIARIALLAYVGSLCFLTYSANKNIDLTFVSGFVTLAATTLATHFGALLGLGELRAKVHSATAAAISAAAPVAPIAAPASSTQEIGIIQLIAAWVYILSLVFAVVLWG